MLDHGEQLSQLIADVVELVCDSQYLVSDLLLGRYGQVSVVMGMGFFSSGPALDVAYYCEVERNLVLSPYMMHKSRIRRYWRYRDDVLLMATTPGGIFSYVTAMRRSTSEFVFKVEAVARASIEHLEVKIT